MAKETARQAGQVLADLPLFLTAPLYRSLHLTWGATPAEAVMPMPGDDLVPGAQYRTTRAITIEAPPLAVWPWLVQVGCGRAGFYSNDLIDNLGRPSARDIHPEWQDLHVGQWVSMSPTKPTEVTAFRVEGYDVGRWLLWGKPDSTWSWVLEDLGDGSTRLITRVHALYDWSHPLMAVAGVLMLELGDFAMMRRMLLGIRQRAEGIVRESSSA